MQNIILALIVAIPAMLSPLLMAWLTNKNRAQEKREDYARQDEVARRADEAAKKVAETAKMLLYSNIAVAETAKIANVKLDQIHVLVNSTLSSAKQSELNAFVALLALMQNPTVVNPAEIENTKRKILELQTIIKERDRQAELAANVANS